MSFSGAGFGLGKMMEGVSGGMLAGTKMQYQDNLLKQERDDAQKKRDAEDELARFNRGLNTVNTAFTIAKGSPDPSSVFRAIQERLNPDGEVIDMTFNPTTTPEKKASVALSWPGSEKGPGWKLNGDPDDVAEVLAFAQANPGRSQEILKKAVDVGLLQAEVIPYVAPKPEKRAGGGGDGSGGGVGKKENKISDYSTGIRNIFAKYRIDTGGMFIPGPDGTATMNPAGMARGKESAYRAIKAEISKGATPEDRAEAARDFEVLKFYYGKIEEKLGVPKITVKNPPSTIMTGPGSIRRMMKMSNPSPNVKAPGALPPGVTEQGIRDTMKKYNKTREQVLAELRKRAGVK